MHSSKKYRWGENHSKESIQSHKIEKLGNGQTYHVNLICQARAFLNSSNWPLAEQDIQVLEHETKHIFPMEHDLNSVISEVENI